QNGFECQRSIGQGNGMGFFVHFGEGALECADPMTGPLIDVAGAQCLDGCSNLVWGVLRPPWRGGDADPLTVIVSPPLAFCYCSVHSRLRCHSRYSKGSRRRSRSSPALSLGTAILLYYQFWRQLARLTHDGVVFWRVCRFLTKQSPLFGRLPAGDARSVLVLPVPAPQEPGPAYRPRAACRPATRPAPTKPSLTTPLTIAPKAVLTLHDIS